jgi:hypothetical protein
MAAIAASTPATTWKRRRLMRATRRKTARALKGRLQ